MSDQPGAAATPSVPAADVPSPAASQQADATPEVQTTPVWQPPQVGQPWVQATPQVNAPSFAPPRTDGLAIAALVVALTFVFAPVGVVLGIVSLVRINKSRGVLGGKGLAIAAIAVGAVLSIPHVIWAVILVMYAFAGAADTNTGVGALASLR